MYDQHGEFLQERMDPDSGLLDKLLANKTLSNIECDDIKDHHPFYRRNARLLDYISQKKKYDSLIGALKDTRQTHLVNYLVENGGIAISFSVPSLNMRKCIPHTSFCIVCGSGYNNIMFGSLCCFGPACIGL